MISTKTPEERLDQNRLRRQRYRPRRNQRLKERKMVHEFLTNRLIPATFRNCNMCKREACPCRSRNGFGNCQFFCWHPVYDEGLSVRMWAYVDGGWKH